MRGRNPVHLTLLLLLALQSILLIAATEYGAVPHRSVSRRRISYPGRKRRSADPGGGDYTPPSSGGYTPPSSGGGYTPPSSGGYTPPSSGGYTPPSYGGGGYGGGCPCPGDGSAPANCGPGDQPANTGKPCTCNDGPNGSPRGCTPPRCTANTPRGTTCICTGTNAPSGCIFLPPCSGAQSTGTMNILGLAEMNGIDNTQDQQLGLGLGQTDVLNNGKGQLNTVLLPGTSSLPLVGGLSGTQSSPTSDLLGGSNLLGGPGLLGLSALTDKGTLDSLGPLLSADALNNENLLGLLDLGGAAQGVADKSSNLDTLALISALNNQQVSNSPQVFKLMEAAPQAQPIQLVQAPMKMLPMSQAQSLSPQQLLFLSGLNS